MRYSKAEINEKAKELRKEYHRNYYAMNKARRQGYQQSIWERKAVKALQEQTKQECSHSGEVKNIIVSEGEQWTN